jgi:UDP-N-acetylglucosamine 2-epimerase (non-hydrolysing)
MKVMVAVGTRPEAIKMAPVIEALRGAAVDTIVCATGQHREMLAQALEVFALTPDVSLDAMAPGQSLNVLASRLLVALDPVLEQEKPDWVLVQGDTTTTLCAGMAAFQRGIRVGHVEAGLRTGNLGSPFPEEANRSMLARIVSRHFAPTRRAQEALLGEGIGRQWIDVTGNTVVDAVAKARSLMAAGTAASKASAIPGLAAGKPLVLLTCHRRENFGGVLEGICGLTKRLCARYREFHWVFPVHPNPGARDPVQRMLGDIDNLSLIDPVDYLTSLDLISRATLVVSDSGGIQEEAPSFGVPVVVMRGHTERLEGVLAGFATLAGQEPGRIETAVADWLDHPEKRAALRERANPYGDGEASRRIVLRLRGEPVAEFRG